MKRYNNLYEKISDIDNIKKAIICASKDKQKRISVIKVLNDLDNHALIIQDMLVNKSYVPSPYIEKKIFDGARKKERVIKKPKFFPDQCIHWSLMLIVEPLFEKRMYKWSCSSIKGRGIHYAKDYVIGALKDKRNTKYAYQLDIRKFYPSIDNDILKHKLRRMFKDNGVLWLFDTIIDSDVGLPIGNYTSQWLANYYLQDLDMFIKHNLKIPYYVRYADDMLLFCSNKRKLHKARIEIEELIHKEKLSIKPNWQIYKVDSRPIDFIGFQFHRDYVVLRDTLYLRIKRRAKRIGKKGYITPKDAMGMTSYWGYIVNSDNHKFYWDDIKPYCDINKCKEIISNEIKKHNQNYK